MSQQALSILKRDARVLRLWQHLMPCLLPSAPAVVEQTQEAESKQHAQYDDDDEDDHAAGLAEAERAKEPSATAIAHSTRR